MDVVAPNTSQRIEVLILDSSNNEVTGGTVTLKIRRRSDGQYWNGSSFQASSTTVNMTEVSASNDPGRYYYTFATSGLPDDEYFLTADCVRGLNVPQTGNLRTGYVSTIQQIMPMMVEGNGVWTEQEKTDLLKTVKEILKGITDTVSVSTGMKESVEKTLGTEGVNIRQTLLTETEKIVGLVKKLSDDVSCKENGTPQDVVSDLLKTFVATVIESVERQEEKIKGLVTDALKDKDTKKVYESILLMEQILLKTAPTEVLEAITHEDDK